MVGLTGAGAGGGGGGGGGAVTFTVAEAVFDPPGPVAVSVYVVELSGCTRDVPALCTVPIPWLMEILVACPVTRQVRVEDWPR